MNKTLVLLEADLWDLELKVAEYTQDPTLADHPHPVYKTVDQLVCLLAPIWPHHDEVCTHAR